jgi:hypothetical protein
LEHGFGADAAGTELFFHHVAALNFIIIGHTQ